MMRTYTNTISATASSVTLKTSSTTSIDAILISLASIVAVI